MLIEDGCCLAFGALLAPEGTGPPAMSTAPAGPCPPTPPCCPSLHALEACCFTQRQCACLPPSSKAEAHH